MKKCYKCQEEKPLDKFAKNRGRKDGLQTICKDCRKKWFHVHYNENKKYYVENAYKHKKERIDLIKQYIRELKLQPCADCKKCYPYYVMDFDHLRDKKYDIATMQSAGLSLKSIKEEIAKCEIVCANCHRERTYGTRDRI